MNAENTTDNNDAGSKKTVKPGINKLQVSMLEHCVVVFLNDSDLLGLSLIVYFIST